MYYLKSWVCDLRFGSAMGNFALDSCEFIYCCRESFSHIEDTVCETLAYPWEMRNLCKISFVIPEGKCPFWKARHGWVYFIIAHVKGIECKGVD
jgi:hypothetical protein